MKYRLPRMRWLLAIVVVACGGLLLARAFATSRAGPDRPPPQDAPAGKDEESPAKTLPPAKRLRVRVGEAGGDGKQLLDLDSTAWDKAVPTKVILSRTPRIYRTEPVRDLPIPGGLPVLGASTAGLLGSPLGQGPLLAASALFPGRTMPELEVRALRSGGKLSLRLRWDDVTENAPKAPPRKTGEGGRAEQLYKRPTGQTAAFADAAAVMVPQRWTGPSFPSLLMGDSHTPARLFYWNASRGAEELTAAGRATPAPTGKSFAHRARHAGGRWTLAMELPDRPEGWPLAFAIWDGETGDRDGLKYFSIWYVLSK